MFVSVRNKLPPVLDYQSIRSAYAGLPPLLDDEFVSDDFHPVIFEISALNKRAFIE